MMLSNITKQNALHQIHRFSMIPPPLGKLKFNVGNCCASKLHFGIVLGAHTCEKQDFKYQFIPIYQFIVRLECIYI